MAPGYIIVWHPPASCGHTHLHWIQPCPQVKVIFWYLRPDAPVLLFSCLFTQVHLLIDGLVEGQYITLWSSSGVPYLSGHWNDSSWDINKQTLKMISQAESFLCPDKKGTPEEGWRIQQLKHCVSIHHNKDEYISPKNLNQNYTFVISFIGCPSNWRCDIILYTYCFVKTNITLNLLI